MLPPDLAILLLVGSSNPFLKELLFSNKAVVVPPTFPKRELVLEPIGTYSSAPGAKW